jgi:hypothetical protein
MAAEIMDNGDVMIKLKMMLEGPDGAKIVKAMKEVISSVEGPIQTINRNLEDVAKEMGEKLNTTYSKIGSTVSETFGTNGVVQVGAFSAQLMKGVKSTQDFDAMLNIATTTTAFLTDKIGKAIDGTNELMKSMMSIRSSAGMTQAEFKGLTDGIMQATAEGSEGIGKIAQEAQQVFDTTGLKKGIGDVVVDATKMSRVFGVSSEAFSSMTAQSMQFSEGAMSANDMMKQFDNTVGLTGHRMEILLDSIKDVGKSLRNMVGGGKDFAKAMQATTQYSGQMLGKFTELGGSADAFNDIQKAILDPKKWSELGQKMPGMAGNFTQMQKALGSGDMDTFSKLLQDGAKKTAEMGAGMNQIARSASGMDFTSAEILAKMDWKKIQSESAGAGSVSERSAKALASLGDQAAKFWNNISVALMRVIMPVMEILSSVMGWINSLMAASQGWGMTFGVVAAGIVIAIFGIVFALKMAQNATIGIAKAVGEGLGKGIGKGAEAAFEGISNGVNKLASTGMKAVVPLLAIGLGLLMVAGAVWIIAKAFQTFAEVGNAIWPILGMLMVGLAGLVVAMWLLYPVTPVLLAFGGAMLMVGAGVALAAVGFSIFANSMKTFNEGVGGFIKGMSEIANINGASILANAYMISMAIGVLLLGIAPFLVPIIGQYLMATMMGVAAAFALLGSAGVGAKMLSEAINEITSSAGAIEALGSKDFSGLDNLGKALGKMFDGVSKGGKLDDIASFSQNTKAIFGIIKDLSKDLEDIVKVGGVLGKHTASVQLVFKTLFDPSTGILVTTMIGLAESLNGGWFKSSKAVDEGVLKSMTGVIDVLKGFVENFSSFAAVGEMISKGKGEIGKNVKVGLDFMIQSLVNCIFIINANKDTMKIDDKTITPMNSVVSVLNSFVTNFASFAAIGELISNPDNKLGEKIKTGLDFMIQSMVNAVFIVNANKDTMKIDDKAIAPMNSLMNVLTSFVTNFSSFAAIGDLINQEGGKIGNNLKMGIDFMVATMVNTVTYLNKTLGGAAIKTEGIESVNKIMSTLSGMNESLISVASMGQVMQGGLQASLMSYADGIGAFLTKMSENAKIFSADDINKMSQFGDAMNAMTSEMNQDIKISAQGGAEVALQEHDSAMEAMYSHYNKVETLLEDIKKNTLSSSNGGSSQASQQTNKYVPTWRPENLFSDKSETF